MALTLLLNLWPFVVVSTLIAGAGCLVSAGVFERRSTRFVLRVGLPVIIAIVGIGTYPLLQARHLVAECRGKAAFETVRYARWRDGATVETDFLAPTTDTYRVTLPDAHVMLLTSPKDRFTVDCKVIADGQETVANSFFITPVDSERAPPTGLMIAQFRASVGRTYQVSLLIPPAVILPADRAVRVRFSYDPLTFNEASIASWVNGGMGESFWLAAYGVFVAAAIRVGLNWRDAADQRVLLAATTPP